MSYDIVPPPYIHPRPDHGGVGGTIPRKPALPKLHLCSWFLKAVGLLVFLFLRFIQDEESAEVHLAMLCILAEDLMRFLDLPVRHAQALWNLIYCESNKLRGI